MKCIIAAFIGFGLVLIASHAFCQTSSNTIYYTFEKDFGPYKILDSTKTISITDGDIWVEDDVYKIHPQNFHFKFLDHKLDSLAINQDNLFMPDRDYFITAFGNFLMFDRANHDTIKYTSGISPIDYLVDSSSGSKILKMQWMNTGFFFDSTSYLNFQIWLYEGTNTLEIRYGKSHVNMNLSQVIGCGPLVGLSRVDTVAGKSLYELLLRGNAQDPSTVTLGMSGKRCLNNVPPEGTIYRFYYHDSAKVVEKFPTSYKVYPTLCSHPDCSGIFHVDITSASPAIVNVYDMTGRRVLSQTMYYGQTMNLSNLRSGMYIVRIDHDNNLFTQKVIITR
jgi:hypothetical protein